MCYVNIEQIHSTQDELVKSLKEIILPLRLEKESRRKPDKETKKGNDPIRRYSKQENMFV